MAETNARITTLIERIENSLFWKPPEKIYIQIQTTEMLHHV